MYEIFSNTQQKQIKALIKKDKATIIAFYKENYPKVYKYIISHGGNEVEVKQVIHDAILRLIPYLERQPNRDLKSGINGLFFGFVKNIWKELLKEKGKKSNGFVLSDDVEISSIEDYLQKDYAEEQIARQRFKLLYQVVGMLGENCRIILTLYLKHDYGYNEIAEILASSYDSIKVRKHKCEKKLIKKIIEHPDFRELKAEGYEG